MSKAESFILFISNLNFIFYGGKFVSTETKKENFNTKPNRYSKGKKNYAKPYAKSSYKPKERDGAGSEKT